MKELNEEIAKLIKSEGYKINESILDAIEDLVEVVEEENEGMEDEEEDDNDER